MENEKVTEEKIWMEKVQMHEQISKVYLKATLTEKAWYWQRNKNINEKQKTQVFQ